MSADKWKVSGEMRLAQQLQPANTEDEEIVLPDVFTFAVAAPVLGKKVVLTFVRIGAEDE